MNPLLRVSSAILPFLVLVGGVRVEPGWSQDSVRPAAEESHLVDLGEFFDFGDGQSITVSDYEEDVPFAIDGNLGHLEGVASLFKAEIHAGSKDLEYFAFEGFFQLSRPVGSGHEFRLTFPAEGIREPRFSAGPLPGNVAAGTCHEGWVVIASPDADAVHPGTTAIVYDNTKIGFIPEDLRLRVAWGLDRGT